MFPDLSNFLDGYNIIFTDRKNVQNLENHTQAVIN